VKLSITMEYTVWCAFCSTWHQDGHSRCKAAFERRMRRNGWKTRKGQTVCHECLAESEAEKQLTPTPEKQGRG